MKKNTFWLTAAVVLSMTFTACNNDAIEVDPDPTPEDSLSNDNGDFDFTFKTTLINNSPFCEITDENFDKMCLAGFGNTYRRFVGKNSGKDYYTSILGVNDYNSAYQYYFNPWGNHAFKYMLRNKDDHEVWDLLKYNFGVNYTLKNFNWSNDVWNAQGVIYFNYTNPNICFVGWSSPTFVANYNRIDTSMQMFVYQMNQNWSQGIVDFELISDPEGESSDNPSGERYYKSELLRDLVIGEGQVAPVIKYSTNLPTVNLIFTHPLARLELKALVEDDEAIDVTVGYAAIGGVGVNGYYVPSWHEFMQPGWHINTDKRYYDWIEMKTPGNVHLTTEAQPLQAKGAEPWVFPQSLKGWTNAAIGDGAGLMLGVWIKNKYDGSYIVGSKDGYDLVYMPLDPITLESENNYVFEVTFGCQYDVNGNPSGYHISYQPQIQEWNKTEKEVNMVKK